MAFKYVDEEMIKKLITSFIWPKLEYATVIWSPHQKKDVKKLKWLQKAATKMPPSLRNFPYEERISRQPPNSWEKEEKGETL